MSSRGQGVVRSGLTRTSAFRGATSSQSDSVEAITDALLTASRLLVGISARSIAAIDDTLTIPQFRVLVTLSHRDSVNLATLAGLLDVKPSAAGRMVDRLVSAGLVDRLPHPTSRRELLVVLSTRGRKIVRSAMTRRRNEIAGIVTNMAPADRRGLVRCLHAFTEAGGEPGLPLDGEW